MIVGSGFISLEQGLMEGFCEHEMNLRVYKWPGDS